MKRIFSLVAAAAALSACQSKVPTGVPLNHAVSAPGSHFCGPGAFKITDNGQIRCIAKPNTAA